MELELLAQLVDDYVEARDARLTAEKAAAKLKAEELVLEERILSQLIGADVSSAAGATHRVTRRPSKKMVVTDWPALWDYVARTGHHELVHKRLAVGFYKELTEGEGEVLPFVESVELNRLSVARNS